MKEYKGLKVPETKYSEALRIKMEEKCIEIGDSRGCEGIECEDCIYDNLKTFEQYEKENNK